MKTDEGDVPTSILPAATKIHVVDAGKPLALFYNPDVPAPPPIEQWQAKLVGKKLIGDDRQGGENVSHPFRQTITTRNTWPIFAQWTWLAAYCSARNAHLRRFESKMIGFVSPSTDY